MSLTNPKDVVTEERLSEFYQGIYPYLGGMPEMVANKFSKGDIYSTIEKMVAVWTDGKPLYQISIQASVSDKTTIPIANISTLNILNWSGVFVQTSSNNTFKLNTTTDAWVYVERSFNGFYFQSTSKWTGTVYITLQYTKTTDSAIAIGTESDYDSTEKIVGTWFGENLWQNTVQFTTPTITDGTEASVDVITLANTEIKTYSGFIGNKYPLVWYGVNGSNQSRWINIFKSSAGTIKVKSNYSDVGGKIGYITLQYTKTS